MLNPLKPTVISAKAGIQKTLKAFALLGRVTFVIKSNQKSDFHTAAFQA